VAILELHNLNKHFGGLQAVKNASCDFPAGKITTVIGPNGAGKTTFFNLVTGFLKPDSGRVFLNGADITGLLPHKIVKAGMVRTFQMVRVFPRLSLLDNLLLGDREVKGNTLFQALFPLKEDRRQFKQRQETALQSLEYIGLAQYAASMANDLSYGQKKLVEIVRALALKPKVLLIDEPLSGLNMIMIEKMLSLIGKIKNEGKTVILIEHNTDVVRRISDKIVVFNFGEVIASGDPEEVFENARVIDSYLGISQK
jgi:ABC-type branched-subunit amino acid transport system ATPase component